MTLNALYFIGRKKHYRWIQGGWSGIFKRSLSFCRISMQDIEIELKRLALLSKSVQDELQQLYDVYLRLVAQAEKTVERTTEYVNFTAAEKLNFQKTCLAIKLISVLSKQDLLDEAKEGEMNKVLDKETKETIQKVHQAAGDGKLLVA